MNPAERQIQPFIEGRIEIQVRFLASAVC
jgi:hypothetical protein